MNRDEHQEPIDPSSIITIDMVVKTVKGLAAMIVSMGIIGAAWVAVGLPLPATIDDVDQKINGVLASQNHVSERVEDNRDDISDLADFARGTRSIVLRQDRRNIQEEIDRYQAMIETGAATQETKRLIEALQEDVDALEQQIEKLDR